MYHSNQIPISKYQVPKKILITGVSGLLGSNLAWGFKDRYSICGYYRHHPVVMEGIQVEKIDLLNPDFLKNCLQTFQPDILIHCAALANVDDCEKNKEEATKMNVQATQNVVEGLENLPTKLIYISTDSVFDGEKGDYVEKDPVHPINHYGWTKYQGEQIALQRSNSLVLRTNIFGWNVQKKESLGEWILHRLLRKERIMGFQDVIFSSIYTMELALLIEQIWKKELSGLFHCASSTSLSKYEFALQLAKIFRLDENLIEPISVDNLSFEAKRPKNLSLSTVKLGQVLGKNLPSLTDSINAFFGDFEGVSQRIRESHE